jgi:hypothetical protein
VLDWETDVDFVTSKIRVSKAWDYEEQVLKPTKTWETQRRTQALLHDREIHRRRREALAGVRRPVPSPRV